MKSLFNQTDASEILDRVEYLPQTARRLWGKMEVAQMLAHCSAVLQMANGEKILPRTFLGWIFGRMAKKEYFNEKPFAENVPSDKHLKITDNRNFVTEKQRLITYIKKFQAAGENGATEHPHPFFGELTPATWGIGMYKHLDHHLRQFGA
ncbi:DUF1569 domain-containing protein [Mucilaginibacter sp. RCC_168]|jgi:hypothetical protein|uniref:DUF1569 domain-containing protein n=1 Tax=Mucilaginibacter sp. RCC_168 TaxID=3239221 RepID=UPI0035240ABE